jgi:Heterokaryon incompatibility protein (HET)
MAHLEYQYLPLETQDTVRVLVLHPALNFEDPLQCNVIHSKREYTGYKNESYEVVSYAWESQQPSRILECQGRVIFITPTVESFLRHIRKGHWSIRLWIDAVCLNQKDSVEKGQQIYNIGEIYREARKCLIWLGEERKHDSELFAFFDLGFHCGAFDDLARESSWFGSNYYNSRNIQGGRGAKNVHFDLTTYRGSLVNILAPFRRPWFTRRWILQEVALSKRKVVRCGSVALQWDIFVSGIRYLERACSTGDLYDLDGVLSKASVVYSVSQPSTEFETLGPNGSRIWRPRTLLNMLYKFAAFECSDPRDRVFALLGFADDADTFNLAQYYSESAEKLYFAVAAQLVKQRRYFELLEYSTIFQSQQSGWNLPLWIPNWASTPLRSLRHFGQDMEPFLYHVGLGCSIGDAGRHLRMTGVRKIGTIRWISDVLPNKAPFTDIASILTQSIEDAEMFTSQQAMPAYYKDIFEMTFGRSKSREFNMLESLDRIPAQEGRYSKIHALITAFASVLEVDEDAVLSNVSEQKFCLAEVFATRSLSNNSDSSSNDDKCGEICKFEALRLIFGPMETRIGDEIWAPLSDRQSPIQLPPSVAVSRLIPFIVRPRAYVRKRREYQDLDDIFLGSEYIGDDYDSYFLVRYLGLCSEPQDYGKIFFSPELGEGDRSSNLVFV